MCWSPEVSLATYLFTAIPLFILTFYYSVIPIPYFLASHCWVSIQLVEFFLWTYLNNPELNYFFSGVGFIVILLEPFFFILTIANYKYRNYVLSLYLFCILLYCATNKIEFKTVVAKNKHLEWKWLDVPLYYAFLWVAFFCFSTFYKYMSNPTKNNFELYALIFILATAGISFATYIESKTWGSMWCWVANIVGFRYYYLLWNLI